MKNALENATLKGLAWAVKKANESPLFCGVGLVVVVVFTAWLEAH